MKFKHFLVAIGLVSTAYASEAVLSQPQTATINLEKSSFAKDEIYNLDVIAIPDDAVRMTISMARKNWQEKGPGVNVVKVDSEYFDGKEWNLTSGLGGFTTDGGVRFDEKGQVALSSYNDTPLPEGTGRKIRVRVISKADLTSAVSVQFVAPPILSYANKALAAVAFVQSPANGNDCGSVTSCNLAFGSNITAGSLIVVAGGVGAIGRTITITDTRSNTYAASPTVRQSDATDSSECTINEALNSTAGANTVTYGLSGAAATLRLAVLEASGVATTNAIDATSSASSASSAAPAAGAKTPSADGELIFAMARTGSTRTYTAGTDFTLRAQVPAAALTRMSTESYVQPIAASHNGDFSISSAASWCAGMVTYKAAAAAVATPGNRDVSLIQKGGAIIIQGGATIIK